MAAPYTNAAVANFPNVANLVSLPNGVARGLGPIGNAGTPYFDDLVAPIKFRTGAAGVGGLVEFYIIMSEDGVTWTGGADPSNVADQSAALYDARKIVTPGMPEGSINVEANATTYVSDEFSVFSVLGFMPTFWAIVVYNRTGAAFDVTAGNFAAQHTLQAYA